eukprot:NODE_2295_length_960_cov_97.080663.p6 GENE.NODE_2295_length_960_cov_97.080663~~NODE_2295_length_960_cov_97.080663.p6  ORF type:complete len:77 (-),score=11.05 NODE_2295_length_960_cov_97.080663:338-568(-)
MASAPPLPIEFPSRRRLVNTLLCSKARAKALARALEHNNVLTSLRLDGNSIGSGGAEAMLSWLSGLGGVGLRRQPR